MQAFLNHSSFSKNKCGRIYSQKMKFGLQMFPNVETAVWYTKEY